MSAAAFVFVRAVPHLICFPADGEDTMVAASCLNLLLLISPAAGRDTIVETIVLPLQLLHSPLIRLPSYALYPVNNAFRKGTPHAARQNGK